MKSLPSLPANPDGLQVWEQTGDVLSVVGGQHFPIIGLILRLVGFHRKTVCAVEILHWPRICYDDSDRGFSGALLAQAIFLVTE